MKLPHPNPPRQGGGDFLVQESPPQFSHRTTLSFHETKYVGNQEPDFFRKFAMVEERVMFTGTFNPE